MRKKTVWVIDDDAIYQIMVKKIIEKSEMFSTITIFKNGKEAIDAVLLAIKSKDILPDIILLDINMPIMDGWEFMEEIQPLKKFITTQVIVYIVSSSIAVEDKNKSKTYPDILGYLSKPVNINDLKLIAYYD